MKPLQSAYFEAEVEYWHDIHDVTGKITGRKRMCGTVTIRVDLADIVRDMGPRAHRSKGKKCRDGHVTVTAKGQAVELSREDRPLN